MRDFDSIKRSADARGEREHKAAREIHVDFEKGEKRIVGCMDVKV